ncbi:hypothetical protein F2P45_23030 [Massilia sp. CCM 8733]|uniref:Uncharacterized protein n=1 Tax=Massilia mucilaginosa TaxID=2609282 RepID=A0ABX0NZ21_9BURK|nr:hypothetical protein [Massilia mucilaginosa]NHZ91856.1 hypothetical protein [Massilia mucilaginosa]
MSTIIYSGEFGRSVAACIAARQSGCAATMLDVAQLRAAASRLEGQVFALFSSLRLDLMQEAAQRLAARATLFTCFAFERHVLLAPPCSPEGICAQCFSRRLLSQPPEPYGAETLFFLAKLAAQPGAAELRAYPASLADLTAQLCLLQERGLLAPTDSVAIDSASGAIVSSRIMPVHGCTCRSPSRTTCAGPQRFTAFHGELSTWLA